MTIEAMCQTNGHQDRPAVGQYRVVHLIMGGVKRYLCAECAEGREKYKEP